MRGAHSLPRSGRHYWEIQYVHPPSLRGKKLEGSFMTGLFCNLRTSYDWNSGISHFWGIGNGKWRRKEAQAVLIEGGSVRSLDDDHEYDLEDEILNEEGVVHGHVCEGFTLCSLLLSISYICTSISTNALSIHSSLCTVFIISLSAIAAIYLYACHISVCTSIYPLSFSIYTLYLSSTSFGYI